MEVFMPNATQEILAKADANEVLVYCNDILASLQTNLKEAQQNYKKFEYLCLLIIEDTELRQGIAAGKIAQIDDDELFLTEFKACLTDNGTHRDLLNDTDENGVSLLMLALAYRNKEIAAFLVKQGISLDHHCCSQELYYFYHATTTLTETKDISRAYIMLGDSAHTIAERENLSDVLTSPEKYIPLVPMYNNIAGKPENKTTRYEKNSYMFWGTIMFVLIIAAGKAIGESPKLQLN